MRILLCDFDLYSTVGGGQSFYRSIIEKNPEIDFFYFAIHESQSVLRPANARAIRYQEAYGPAPWRHFPDLSPPRWCLSNFLRARNMAASVAGRSFDVVDLPDYEQFGMFLRPAFREHRVASGRIALSLHGRISTSINLNWKTEGSTNDELNMLEDWQYRAVDLRYGLSRRYLSELKTAGIESYYLNPLRFLSVPEPSLPRSSAQPPDIHFIGRTEKRKGPDIFVDLAWWLPRDSYGRATIIGPENIDSDGTGSTHHLRRQAQSRFGSECIEMLPSMTTAQLQEVFRARSVVVLPSRYDTFNLCAVESLFAGCPTAIGDGAGVCQYLEEDFPDVPFLKIDTSNIYSSIPPLLDVLENYDSYRRKLVAALKAANWSVSGSTLAEIYGNAPTFDAGVREEVDEWYERLMSHAKRKVAGKRGRALRLLRRAASDPRLRRSARKVRSWVKRAAATSIRSKRVRNTVKAALFALKARRLASSYRQIHAGRERTAQELEDKIQHCENLASKMPIDRVRLWRELARLEAVRGRELVAATYRLRAMRLCGQDQFGDLRSVKRILHEHDFPREAAAAEAMYGAHPERVERCADILKAAYSSNRQPRNWDFEVVDDRRDRGRYRVSVIVSLYNAADRLPVFLETLSLQTLMRAGDAELILIDSGSKMPERAVVRQTAERLQIPIVYARSAQRETIQSAWNRGISLSRSEYLTFLGVDEGILPQSLDVLADELDSDPSLDWVQANSLVTHVSDRCNWLSDVMTYDRTNYRQPFVYLDTCYLSWVGALYRRSIHDRFGMYDASFAAAGDTEFKNRVLPWIRSKVLPQTLGVFWNYPSDRMTCSPRAEIEDLRAWYLHRTLAGVQYAFERHDPRNVEELFHAALGYRKSFCSHQSTDIEYAHNLSLYLEQHMPAEPVTHYFAGVERLLAAYRSLDYIACPSANSIRRAILGSWNLARKVGRQHQRLSGQQTVPPYSIFNDNRYEQHSNVWPAAAVTVDGPRLLDEHTEQSRPDSPSVTQLAVYRSSSKSCPSVQESCAVSRASGE